MGRIRKVGYHAVQKKQLRTTRETLLTSRSRISPMQGCYKIYHLAKCDGIQGQMLFYELGREQLLNTLGRRIMNSEGSFSLAALDINIKGSLPW